MKKSIITLTACLLALWCQAAPVDVKTARNAAASFVANTLRLRETSQLAKQNTPWSYQQMYLFAFGQGFVIVAADDAARPILAYSLDGGFDAQKIPVNLKGILDTYEAEIGKARQDGLPADPSWGILLKGRSLLAGAKDVPTAVGPLVTTRWGQYAPYNGMCPSGVPSGCVATATTQVMRYWNYPAFGQGSHSYNCATFGNLSADFAHTRYDWANMPETGASSAEERTALATLTFHVGVSVNMDYNYTQSGATTGGGDNCALEALRKYFHYNRHDLNYRSKGTTSDSAWTEYLMAELRQLRPILYDGTAGAFGGHSFICDGYDSLRLMHFNLGEFGEGDGFYAVGSIIYMQYNLNGNNSAITGIHPEYGIYVSDTVLTYHRSGGDSQIWVMTSDTSQAAWTATADRDWISLGDMDFDHLGTMTVTLAANNTGSERTGTVTLRQGSHQTQFAVRQAAFDEEDFCTLTVVMENTRNQAWTGGAHVSFESPDGMVYATATHSANSGSSTATVSVAPRNVVVKWVGGGPLDRFYNYFVLNASGDTLVKVENAYYNGTDVLLDSPCSSLGIEDGGETGSLDFDVFPNPASDYVEVRSEVPMQRIVVRDMAGRQVLVTDIQTGTLRIDTRSWAAGIYVLQVLSDNGNGVRKIIKN